MSAYIIRLLIAAIMLGDVDIHILNNKSVVFVQEFNGKTDFCRIDDIGLGILKVSLYNCYATRLEQLTDRNGQLITVCRADEVPALIRAWRSIRTAKVLALGYPIEDGPEHLYLLTESHAYPIPDGSLEWFQKRIR